MKPKTKSIVPRLALLVLATGVSLASAKPQGPPTPVEVRFLPAATSPLGPAWRTGTLISHPGDCAQVITADPTARGGRRVLQLAGIQKLERRDGAAWIAVPVKALSAKEPRWCREVVGG